MSKDNETVRDDSPENSPDPLGIIGWVIGGKYKIESYISGGGFGEVYAGYNKNLTEQRVVVKFFKRVQSREKFDKEARILCQLDHPNINRVIDYLPDEGAAVVAFIDGHDGSALLKKHGALPEKLFLNVARSMTQAIAYAHSKKIAHRDLKPGNILVDKDDHVYLIDFGIAKEIGGDATKTAHTALTPMFAAPERQVGDVNYNPFLSDIYEMGVTLFNFATNSLPYRNPINPNFGEWGGQAAEHLYPEMRRILLKATHPNPEKRYQTTRAMADDLENVKQAFGGKKSFPVKSLSLVIIVVLLCLAGWQYQDELYIKYLELTKSFQSASQPSQKTTEETKPPPLESDSLSQPKKQKGSASTTTEKKETIPVIKPSDKTKAPVEKPKEEKKPKPKPEPKPPVEEKIDPPPVPESEILINLAPANNGRLLVNNISWKPGTSRILPLGTYTITAIHPDYPIYTKRIKISKKNEEISIDLIQEYRQMNLIDIQLALSPPSSKHFLELGFNGRKQTISRFPALDLRQAEGEWLFTVQIKLLGTGTSLNAKVDSCVTFPYGGGPRSVVRGDSGTLRIGSKTAGEISSVPLVVFWSE
ncbi:MAG: serine/threonine protein kinase [candidate division Zixibacteria bacterium]|nr:serine/threonine protein kinase [candidate division Zixibacteria bacterium]